MLIAALNIEKTFSPPRRAGGPENSKIFFQISKIHEFLHDKRHVREDDNF